MRSAWQRWRIHVAFCVILLYPLLAGAATEIVHFDLRQEGAAALVIVDGPDGQPRNILIDTGRASSGSQGAALVRDELAKRGVKHVDLVILTHLDADHAEGMFTLLGMTRSGAPIQTAGSAGIRGPPVSIGRILLPADALPEHLRFREQLVSAAESSGSTVVSPTADAIAEIEADYSVTVLVPPTKANARPNETSLVIVGYDHAKNTAFMFTGDIPAGMIRQMLPKLPAHVNVLQAPHHGADTGVLDLVAKTGPDYIVIAADKGNRYAHPRLSVLRGLASIRPAPRLPTAAETKYRALFGSPRESETLYEAIYGRPGRFGTARLAREVDARVERALHDLEQPGGLAHVSPPYFTDSSDLMKLAALPDTVRGPSGGPVEYDQVLITGERGNLRFIDGSFTGDSDAETASFMALIWNELRETTDAELLALRSWEDAQAYLSIVAAARVANADQVARDQYVAVPRKAGQKESFAASSEPAPPGRLTAIKRSRLLELGRSRVTRARWNELLKQSAAQGMAEREAALRDIRRRLLHPLFSASRVNEAESSMLIAAAVADYETSVGDKHITEATRAINHDRERERTARMDDYREEMARRMAGHDPTTEHGWLGLALVKLGLPEGLASFSGGLLEAAAEVRLLP